MWNINVQIQEFFRRVAVGEIDIYNEFSLQHEMGFYLRGATPDSIKVQFERPVSFFGIQDKLIKKEIDIALFVPNQSEKVAIELKYPRNGQYPEQMFKACQDISFLEQLCAHGFDEGYFIMAADDPLLYQAGGVEGIYKHFRCGVPLSDIIHKPTGLIEDTVTLLGSYTVGWSEVKGKQKYAVVSVNRSSMP